MAVDDEPANTEPEGTEPEGAGADAPKPETAEAQLKDCEGSAEPALTLAEIAPVSERDEKDRPQPRDPLIRAAYKEAFGVDVVDVKSGPGFNREIKVAVIAPSGEEIPGFGRSWHEATDALIAALNAIARARH